MGTIMSLLIVIIISLFVPFIVIGYRKRNLITIITSAILYLLGLIIAVIMLEKMELAIYLILNAVLWATPTPPLGVLFGLTLREFVNKIKEQGFWSSVIILRKILPALYIVLLTFIGINPIALILSIALLAIEWYYFPRDMHGLELTIMNTLVLFFMPLFIAITFTIMITLILQGELMKRAFNPWLIVVTYAFSATLTYVLMGLSKALIFLIPVTYILILAVVEALMYLGASVNVRTEVPLRFVEGKSAPYELIIETRPRLSAAISIKSSDGITIEQPMSLFNGQARVRVHAQFNVGGVIKPLITITFKDLMGLISVRRVVEHPQIVVIPRTTYILGLSQKILSGYAVRSLGDIAEVKEYVPGDPIRKIHWAKSAKLDKYVIKVSSRFTNTIAIIPYASNTDNLRSIEEVLMTTIMHLLNQGVVPSFLVIDIIGGRTSLIKWGTEFTTTLLQVLSKLGSLNVAFNSRSYGGSELFRELRSAYQDSLMRLIAKERIETPLILIGEERLSHDVLRILQRLFGHGNVKPILI